MGVVRITMFSLDQEPITAEIEYEPEMTLKDQGKKLAIYAGDDVAGGTLLLPLDLLSACMSTIMQADKQVRSGIVMPEKPGIIRPN